MTKMKQRCSTGRIRFPHTRLLTGLLCLWCASAAMGTAQAASEVVLHSFASPPKGAIPQAGVILDGAGNLYGTTSQGGTATAGVVYKLSPTGQETVLHSLTGGADGGNPWGNPRAGVIRDPAGNRYGATSYGGTAGQGAYISE